MWHNNFCNSNTVLSGTDFFPNLSIWPLFDTAWALWPADRRTCRRSLWMQYWLTSGAVRFIWLASGSTNSRVKCESVVKCLSEKGMWTIAVEIDFHQRTCRVKAVLPWVCSCQTECNLSLFLKHACRPAVYVEKTWDLACASAFPC